MAALLVIELLAALVPASFAESLGHPSTPTYRKEIGRSVALKLPPASSEEAEAKPRPPTRPAICFEHALIPDSRDVRLLCRNDPTPTGRNAAKLYNLHGALLI